eukprot:Mrub_00682.p1 GENE.Mrub_00682~~Mrub_00682.p1  ORF type:complete len:945 (+),score=175.14 Mrub_00682:228-2837(+)
MLQNDMKQFNFNTTGLIVNDIDKTKDEENDVKNYYRFKTSLKTKSDAWKTVYKDFTNGGKDPIDLRSVEEKSDNYYAKGYDSWKDFPIKNYREKEGDGTSSIDSKPKPETLKHNLFKIADEKIKLWRKLHAALTKNLSKNEAELNKRLKYLPIIRYEYNLMTIVALSTLRYAKKLITYYDRLVVLIEDSTQSIFRYHSMSYLVDLVNNSPMPLPYYWATLNPKFSTEEETQWKQIETSKIKMMGSPKSTLNEEPYVDYGVILYTRFHRTFDGSFHFTIKANSTPGEQSKAVFGAFFRFTDQFNHYQLKLNPTTRKVSFARNTSKNYEFIGEFDVSEIGMDVNLRVVIQFSRLYFKFWVKTEDDSSFNEIDHDKRKKELEFKSGEQPFQLNDTHLKEGRIGFFSNDVSGLEIKNITFWADECFIPDYTYLEMMKNLISPNSFNYKENYKGLASFKYNTYTMVDSRPSSTVKFTEGSGNFQRVLKNVNPTFNPKIKNDCALFAYLSDKNALCIDKCSTKFSFNMKKPEDDMLYLMKSINAGFNFKYTSGLNHFTILIKYKHSTNEFTMLIVKTVSQIKVISTKKVPRIKFNKWHDIVVYVLGNEVYVSLDKKWIFNKVEVDGLYESKGTSGFCINGSITMFGGFGSSKMKLNDMGSIRGSSKGTSTSGESENGQDGLPGSQSDQFNGSGGNKGGGDEETAAAKGAENEKLAETASVCFTRTTAESRSEWCVNEIQAFNVQTCVEKYCEVCCGLYEPPSKIKACAMVCANGTGLTQIHFDDYFKKCYESSEFKYNSYEKFEGCSMCCNEHKSEYIEEKHILKCKDECYNIYTKDRYNKHEKSLDYRNYRNYTYLLLAHEGLLEDSKVDLDTQ